MPMDPQEKQMLLEHDKEIQQLRESIIVLGRDQENLRQYVAEMKDDFKRELHETKIELQRDFGILRNDVMGALKSAKEAVPKWASIAIAALGVLVGVIGLLHGW